MSIANRAPSSDVKVGWAAAQHSHAGIGIEARDALRFSRLREFLCSLATKVLARIFPKFILTRFPTAWAHSIQHGFP